jgi:hypothetical protein
LLLVVAGILTAAPFRSALAAPEPTAVPPIHPRVVEGHVWLADPESESHRGLPKVRILAGYDWGDEIMAPTLARIVAYTDEEGYYRADLSWIPVGATARIWPERSGFAFKPPAYQWVVGSVDKAKTLDFRAVPILTVTPPPPPTVTITPPPPPTVTITPEPPALRIFGSVQSVGDEASPTPLKGLAGVKIYLALASYPGKVVATTDERGFFDSGFIPLPHRETIRLWAEKEGYRIEPPEYVFLYEPSGRQEREFHFKAMPVQSPGRIVSGYVRRGGPQGEGLPGVKIYRGSLMQLRANPEYIPTPIAVTDEEGFYRADLGALKPHDRVWIFPVKPGFRFQPPFHRIPAGPIAVDRTYDFIAMPRAGAPRFRDIPQEHPAAPFIEQLFEAGFVKGCSQEPAFCPFRGLTRDEMAVLLVRHGRGPDFTPPEPPQTPFVDKHPGDWALKWAAQLHADGLTTGCSLDPPRYCGADQLSYEQAAVFFSRLLMGQDFIPPAPSGLFSDADATHWSTDWLEFAYKQGLLPPCEAEPRLAICPTEKVPRAMVAYTMATVTGRPDP